MRKPMLPTLAMLALACGSLCFGGENPLAALPSKPGAHLEKIRALGDDAWLDLGSPAPDAKWGKARGRAYSPKMAYAADLGGAFFCGCGVHGYVKPDGHYMDDLWFYDMNAHTWICLYPGANKETRLKLDEHGFEVRQDGTANPVSYFSHGYDNLTYVPDRKKLMMIFTVCPWWTKAVPQRFEWLGLPPEQTSAYKLGKLNTETRHPIFWDVATNRFERVYVEDKTGPRQRFEGVLEYLPDRKQAFFLYQGGVFFYDFAANKWTDTKAREAIKYDSIGCYDPRRDRVYVLKGKSLYGYDLKKNAWSTLAAASHEFGSSTRGRLDFDQASGLVVGLSLQFDKDGQHGGGACVYDPDANTWTDLPARRPNKKGVATAFYSAELNAHFVHIAGDSRDDGTMLVYRYKRAAQPVEQAAK